MSALEGIDRVDALRAVSTALAEDLGTAGDITSQATIQPHRHARAELVAREEGVLAGAPVVELVFQCLGAPMDWEWRVREGEAFSPGQVLGTVRGDARVLLSGERVALNFLQRLSGVATLTRRFVAALEGTGTVLLDTRKTTPGLRGLERYAVRVGGGCNHRRGLYDRVLVKDNHVAMVGSVAGAVAAARRAFPWAVVEVEVRSVAQLREACGAGPDWILLDNMDLATLRACVLARDEFPPPRPKLEASGGVRLETVRDIALTGVDAVSVGSLTRAARWIDIALEVVE